MNNSVFGKVMENVRKHRDIKLVATDQRRSKLVSEAIDRKRSKLVSETNYHTTKFFSNNLITIEMKK